jgi:hypothetical protein
VRSAAHQQLRPGTLAYRHLETDAEMIDRASAKAGHRVQHSCCFSTVGAFLTADQLAQAHGVERKILEVTP